MLLAAIATLLILDFIWIGINKRLYAKLVQGVQGAPMRVRLPGAIVAYSAMVAGLIFIAVPLAARDTSESKLLRALKYGGLFGLIVYAIYNGTNYAIFGNYSLGMALLDTAWGTFVYTIAVYVALLG